METGTFALRNFGLAIQKAQSNLEGKKKKEKKKRGGGEGNPSFLSILNLFREQDSVT